MPRGGGGCGGGGGFSRSPAVSSPRPAQRPALAGGRAGAPRHGPAGPRGVSVDPESAPEPAARRRCPPDPAWAIARHRSA